MNTKSRRRPLIAGNWKMNGLSHSLAELALIAKGLDELDDELEALICPPATLIGAASAHVRNTRLIIGAQDCSSDVEGAFTGDVSAAMIADSGARYVILGHSERRQGRGESNIDILQKVERGLSAKIGVIVCVGETEQQMAERRTEQVLRAQLLESVPPDVNCSAVTIAYEPVWAIGTGRVPTPARIADVHASVRETISDRFGQAGEEIRILYGGSVKPENAREISATPNVDGVLVGGASLKARDFLSISEAFAVR
ncbi:triose-phosphate isomerase [Neorhizobium sp. JUb45]|uniref:triose-phosphate isomerase n=1 Tax=Neorhizobium sp. JUb45 TaxID=2485113 RepID=UPI001043976C|nr:triose-phosphate isomerase [Neorhizobium sp. JUb45]TCQ95397.1 triosephosphate isomerase [Neorhizobium sp. JUb45]